MDLRRSFLSLDFIEIGAALAAAFGVGRLLYGFFWTALPFGSELYAGGYKDIFQLTYAEAWAYYGSTLFQQAIVPVVLFAALAAVALVRALRKDVRHSSLLGNLALAWPLAGTVLASLTWSYCCYFWPVGLVLGAIALVQGSRKQERDFSGVLAIAVNLVWFVWVSLYAMQLTIVYGD